MTLDDSSKSTFTGLLDVEVLGSLRDLQSDADPHFVKNFFTALLEPLPRRLIELKNAVLKNDPRQLAQESHAVKSSCSNAGIHSVVGLCGELEALGRSGSVEGASEIIFKLEGLVSELEAEIRGLPEFSD